MHNKPSALTLRSLTLLLVLAAQIALLETAVAQPPRRPALPQRMELDTADIQMFPEPPSDITQHQPQIPHGKLEIIEYLSKTVGTTRRMNVYTPPLYSTEKKYPVLYLLHGIGGDETEWQRFADPANLFDNLIASEQATPMIVVMPNGRAQKNDRAEGNVFAATPAFATFEQDLLNDVIPAIESRYSVQADRDHRGLAGLSMGAGQSLNFAFASPDKFAWLAAFSAAPNTRSPEQLIPPGKLAENPFHLIWLSCGSRDDLLGISQRTQRYLRQQQIPHIWNLDHHAHDPTHWKHNLFHFARLVFNKTAATASLRFHASPAQAPEISSALQYPKHLQGIGCDGHSLFWSFTTTLVKSDLQGTVLKSVPVADHHGDLCVHDGKVFVAVNLGKFNDPAGHADSWVFAYDAASLKELARYPVPEVFHGAGGIGVHNGNFFIVGGLPETVPENYVYEYDARFTFQRKHTIASGHTELGIQTAAFAHGRWYFGCYGKPQQLLITDTDFRLLGRYPWDCSLGIEALPGGRLLSASGLCSGTAGCTGKIRTAIPDEQTGLKLLTP
jgi:enterochelin esterase-like enzyme